MAVDMVGVGENQTVSQCSVESMAALSGSLICTHQMQLGELIVSSRRVCASPREPLPPGAWAICTENLFVCGSGCLHTHTFLLELTSGPRVRACVVFKSVEAIMAAGSAKWPTCR